MSTRQNSQKFIGRNRAPRVQIEYDVELYGAQKKVQLPFVMGVMSDLSGANASELPAIDARKALEFDVSNFDSRMQSMKPRVSLSVPNSVDRRGAASAVDMTFESMDDFSPAEVARKVEPLRKLLEARTQLANLGTYLDGKSGAEKLIAQAIKDPALLQALGAVPKDTLTSNPATSEESLWNARTKIEQGVQSALTEVSEFSALLSKEFKPKNERAREEVEAAVRTLAEHVLQDSNVVSDDLTQTINAYVAEIDRKLSEQLNQILHDAEFQQLEGAWRGLHHLVTNTETDPLLKIRVMNVSKKELARNLKRFKGVAWDQSPVFKRIYEEEYGQLGGEPYGCLIGDYYFDHGPQDVELLRGIAQVAAAAHAPFISAAGSSLLGMENWNELANPRDLSMIFTTPDYAAWRSLRETDDARYLALTMPRTLARLPYGAKTDPVEDFDFEEDTEGADSSKYTWQNAAYAMAVNINRSFKYYGWCTRIRGVESGGAVENLPVHTFPSDDGGVDMKCPTEIAITDRRSSELDKMGLMPLVHRKNSDIAAFIGAQSVAKPEEYDDPSATANSNLSARLPYMFACCRFAHYLKCIVRDKIGSFSTREQMESWLSNWVMNYVDGDPKNSSEETKARKPLAAAEVVVEEVEGNPGYYTSKFFLKPHYQLEGLTVSLRLVSRLPSAQAA